MTDEYRIERMSPEKIDDFIVLVKDAFGIETTREDCEGLFATDAWGRSYIGYIAYHQQTNEPAAFYGIFPSAGELDGREILIAQSGSTMTHSRHRRKGLFYRLAQATFDLARREGIAFVYGFPNLGTSHPGLIKLGWTHDGEMLSYHSFVPTIPLGYLSAKVGFLRGVHKSWFRFVTSFWRAEYRPFVSSAKEDGFGSVIHDERFFQYRREIESRFMLRVAGKRVVINHVDGIVGIGDVELGDDSESELREILRRLKLICLLTGCVQLRTYLSPGCRLERLFAKLGYKRRIALPNCYLALAEELPMDRFKYVYADLDTF